MGMWGGTFELVCQISVNKMLDCVVQTHWSWPLIYCLTNCYEKLTPPGNGDPDQEFDGSVQYAKKCIERWPDRVTFLKLC